MRNKLPIYLAIIFTLLIGILYFVERYKIIVNISHSLPNRFFLVDTYDKNPELNSYIAFIPPENPYYRQIFVKIVKGKADDSVKIIQNKLYINEQFLGIVKTKSKLGKPLKPGPTGTIPLDYFFVYSPHKDSYDSRYSDIGWISRASIVGVALPLF